MSQIQIVEVGLRDGLQNEKTNISLAHKLEMAEHLLSAGTKRLELGAFVRADKIPQMADSLSLIQKFYQAHPKFTGGSALVPNEKGMHEALKSGVKEIAVFIACSESFSQKNINCTIAESFERLPTVFALAKKNKIKVRGYLSVCFGCPYEGDVAESVVVSLASKLIKMGCYEVSVGDTIGVASPKQVKKLLTMLFKKVPKKKIAMHFHDTRGTALANIHQSYEMGVRVFDSSIGGLGGCPYAPGASGNVATEDVVYLFEKMGVKTGLSLSHLIQTSQWIKSIIGRALPAKLALAGIPAPLGAVKPKS